MAPSESQTQKCSECGIAASAIADWTIHTAWHAGGPDAESQGAVLDFLAGVNPDELEQHMAAQALKLTTGQAALQVLMQMASQ